MIIINDCVQETTLNLEINGVCTSPSYILNQSEQMFLELIKQNEQCCASLSKYMLGIAQQLNNQQYLIEKLTANCIHNYYEQPICIPCQVIEPVHQPIRPKELTQNTYAPFYIAPVSLESIKRYNMILYPIDYRIKGGFAIIGIPGTWQLRNGLVYNEAGDELSQYLEITNESFNKILYRLSNLIKKGNYKKLYQTVELLPELTNEQETTIRGLIHK